VKRCCKSCGSLALRRHTLWGGHGSFALDVGTGMASLTSNANRALPTMGSGMGECDILPVVATVSSIGFKYE
jgi:hypothetical protein